MIEVFNLGKRYGNKQVLDDVTFSAENGVVTGFVGPNGAGKSTTMRMIAQLEHPDAGQALVDGAPFAQSKTPLQTMGIYLGSDYLPNNMTGLSYLEYVCHVSGIAKDNIPGLLQAVELLGAEDRKISSYSLGMRQRIGLAAAIAGDANTLMLDEPVNGLDPMGVQWLRGIVRSQAASGKAVLLSSHLLSELELVADKIVMLDRGQVVAQGYLAELSAQSQGTKHVAIRTSNDAKIARYCERKNIPVYRDDDQLVISGIEPQKLARLVVKNGLDLYLLEEQHASLEEMFMAKAGVASPTSMPMQQMPPTTPQVQFENPYGLPNSQQTFQTQAQNASQQGHQPIQGGGLHVDR